MNEGNKLFRLAAAILATPCCILLGTLAVCCQVLCPCKPEAPKSATKAVRKRPKRKKGKN